MTVRFNGFENREMISLVQRYDAILSPIYDCAHHDQEFF
jgi:hypothetical protein